MGNDAENISTTAVPEGLEGVWGSLAENHPNLVFGPDHRVTGSDGCNRMGGGYTVEGARLVFARMITTRKFCVGIDQWLSSAGSAELRGETLVVFNGDGREIGSLSRSITEVV